MSRTWCHLRCGCRGLALGTCNCQNETLDAVGICGGNCTDDVDNDDICDDVDDCVNPDICGVCGGPGAVYGADGRVSEHNITYNDAHNDCCCCI